MDTPIDRPTARCLSLRWTKIISATMPHFGPLFRDPPTDRPTGKKVHSNSVFVGISSWYDFLFYPNNMLTLERSHPSSYGRGGLVANIEQRTASGRLSAAVDCRTTRIHNIIQDIVLFEFRVFIYCLVYSPLPFSTSSGGLLCPLTLYIRCGGRWRALSSFDCYDEEDGGWQTTTADPLVVVCLG